jgi:hypothetical protein
MPDVQHLLTTLIEHDVRFVLIGGLAAAAHGSSLLTEDVDVCIAFDVENMTRLLAALRTIHPEHRLIGRRQPLSESAEQLARLKNLYLKTDVGYIDFLSEVAGVGNFGKAMEASVEMTLFEKGVRVLDLDALIASKQEMGRPKDKETLLQLRTIRERTS